METKDYAKIVTKNLKRVMIENDKTQAELSRDLNIPKTTLSGWMNGARCPKMKSIDMLCRYFGVTRSELTEECSAGTKASKSSEAEAAALFSALNEAGQQQALTYLRFLLSSEEYKKKRYRFGIITGGLAR